MKKSKAGHPKNFDTQFTGEKSPHSIYCTDKEMKLLKFVLEQKRALNILTAYEPFEGNQLKYIGTQEEWDDDYRYLQLVNLLKIDNDPDYAPLKEQEISIIVAKCVKG